MTTFSARTDRHLVRASARSRRHVLLTLTAPKPRRKPPPPDRWSRQQGSDTELKELAAQLIAEEATFSAPMPELDRKGAYYRSANVQRSRDPDGQARR